MTVEVVTDAEFRTWIDIAVDAFMNLDGTGSVPPDAVPREHLREVLEEMMGVQKALLQRRLADASAAGCTLAVVTTAPGTRSQDNVMRRGFELLYTRAILVKRQDPERNAP